jgi:hypothetical protein
MMIVPVTRSLIYQAIAKQMVNLANPVVIPEYTTVFIDRADLFQYDEDIHRLLSPLVERHGSNLEHEWVDEIGSCGVLAFGFAFPEEAIIFARECESALSEIEFATVVSVWDSLHHIKHEPEAPKRKRDALARRGEGV